MCRSANAAMCTLYESGVPFRMIVHEGGTIECWQQPELPAWEVPKRDPHERRPRAPDYWEPEEAAEIAELAAASDDAADGDSPHSEPRRCHHERALVTKVCNVQGTKNLPAPTIAAREQSRHPDRSNVLANVCPFAVLLGAFGYLTSA